MKNEVRYLKDPSKVHANRILKDIHKESSYRKCRIAHTLIDNVIECEKLNPSCEVEFIGVLRAISTLMTGCHMTLKTSSRDKCRWSKSSKHWR